MRVYMIILLILSFFDITIEKNNRTYRLDWIFRLTALIIFLLNY